MTKTLVIWYNHKTVENERDNVIMVKHVILWEIDPSYDEKAKKVIKSNAKRELEALVGKIDGLLVMHIQIEALPSSNADFMLYSEFADEAALRAYAAHPLHNAVADVYVRPFTCRRMCLDYLS